MSFIKRMSHIIPDSLYIKLVFHKHFGRFPDLKNPQTYNEKLQWIKLHDRRPEYIKMVDKYVVKQYIADTIGDEYVIPTLGVWDDAGKIEWDKLPEQFVLKCNHDSGGIVICKNKSSLNIDEAVNRLNKCLKNNGYWYGREWPYKHVKPLILAEQYMEDNKTNELRDYKIFTFNGVAKALFIATDRQAKDKETTFDFFDTDYNHLPFTNGHPNAATLPEKPEHLDEMIKLAEKLSRGIPHLRVDFYEVNGKIYFGELTFFHWSGFVPFDPEEWDYRFGSWITLPG